MISGKVIVAVGSAWDYDPTCKHHIIKALARQNRIVWINYHGSRKPRLDAADIRTALGKLREVSRGVRPVANNFVQVTPLVIPGAAGGATAWLHRRLLVTQIRRAIRAVAPTSMPVHVWSFAPDVPYLRGQFNEELFVYYCPDEFAEFEGYDAQHIAATERRQIEQADLVFTTSRRLRDSKKRIRHDVHLMPHGVDYDKFAAAWREDLDIPLDLAEINGPTFGFFGLISDWVDVELLADVAISRPQYQFVMIGEARVDISAWKGLANIHVLGRRDHDRLPNYCACFDAGLMLFRRNIMTEHVNPIKMFEYLAAGLPIVSTPLPEAKSFRKFITFADSPESFARACDHVLDSSDMKDRPSISHCVSGESWDARIGQISTIVAGRDRNHSKIARKTLGATAPFVEDLEHADINKLPETGSRREVGSNASVAGSLTGE